jgi:hypothetical protein
MPEAARVTIDVSSTLDRLTGEFASSIARVESDEIDAAVADVLEQIGRALGADQVSLSGKPSDGDVRIVLRSWTQRTSSSGENPSATIVVAQGHSCSMSIAACRSQLEWPSDVLDRLRLLTNLMELKPYATSTSTKGTLPISKTSSVRARVYARRSRGARRSRQPTPRSFSWAKPAPAKSCSPEPCTGAVRDVTRRSCASIARRYHPP